MRLVPANSEKPNTRPRPQVAGWFALALSIVSGPIAHAQTTPMIEFLFPPGAQRGTAVEVHFEGEFLPDAGRLTSSGNGIALQAGGAADRYRFSLAADAAAGPREIRLSSVQGASRPFPFVIGELPEVIHANQREPLALKLPVTANGRLDAAGDIDEYAVTLAAGAQIVCAAKADEIRSPLDPVIRLLDAQGKPLAISFPHRSADALLVFRAPTAGRYTLQVFDFQMAGGAKHIYRLTVTDGPWLDYAFPAGVSRNVETPVTVYGWNLPTPPGEALTLHVPPQPVSRYELTLPGCVNRLSLPVGVNAELLEAEPNDVVTQAAAVPTPGTVNGRLNKPGDIDVFGFTAKKGEKFALDVDSADLQFPTDAVLAVLSESGKSLVEVDDVKTSRDPSIRFTAPADGRYFVSLRDRSGGGGEDCVYRLHLSTALRPQVTARVNTSSLMVHSGQTTNLPVLVERVDGLDDELEVTAFDLLAGVEVKPQPVPAKTPATIQLPFTVADNTAPIGGLVRIVVRNTKTSESNERIAVIADSAAATSGSSALWLAVSPEIPLTLKTTTTILDAPRMAAFPFPVSVERKAGFSGPIRLVGVEPDRRGTLIPLIGQIAADRDVGSIPLVLQHKVTEGTTHRSRVMGVAEVPGADGKTYAVFHVAPGNMSVGCQPSLLTLTVEPAIVTWRPGQTQRIEVQLMRRTTMQPITLRLAPTAGVVGIECDPVEVGSDQNRAVLTLRFAPEAKLPPRTTIEIKAESSRDGLPIYGTASFRLESP